MSATPDSTLADPEQLIADLQRQLAERIAERDEALDQQTATAEVLQVINSSLGNLAPVFDTMLEKALRLCDAAFGFMATLDGELVRVVAERGIPAELSEYHRDPYQLRLAPLSTASCMERKLSTSSTRLTIPTPGRVPHRGGGHTLSLAAQGAFSPCRSAKTVPCSAAL